MSRATRTRGISFGKILTCLDHGVGTIPASHSVLLGSSTLGHRFLLGATTDLRTSLREEGHHEERSVSTSGFGERRDLTRSEVLQYRMEN